MSLPFLVCFVVSSPKRVHSVCHRTAKLRVLLFDIADERDELFHGDRLLEREHVAVVWGQGGWRVEERENER